MGRSHDSCGEMESGNEAAFLIGASVVFVAGHCCFGWEMVGSFIPWKVLGLVDVVGGSL